MKKKIVTLLVASSMVLALVGCGSSKKEEAAPAPAPAATEEVAEVEEAEEPAEEEVVDVEEEGFASLEDYYAVQENYDGLMASLQEVYDANQETYSAIAFNVVGNTVTFQYKLLETPDYDVQESISEYFEGLSDDDWAGIKADVIRSSEIEDDIEVDYEYYDPDENLLASYAAAL